MFSAQSNAPSPTGPSPEGGGRRIEQNVMATESLLPTIATHSNKSVSAALTNVVRLYLDLREDHPPAATTLGMPDLLMPLLTGA